MTLAIDIACAPAIASVTASAPTVALAPALALALAPVPVPAPQSDILHVAPEVVLFVGALVLTVAVMVVVGVFIVRALRAESAANLRRGKGGA
jgi:hypothetical protein